MKITFFATDYGDLCCYQTGERLRSATRAETAASRDAARTDGGAGVIDAGELSRPIAAQKIAKIERGFDHYRP